MSYRFAILFAATIVGLIVMFSVPNGSTERESVAAPANLDFAAGDVNKGQLLARQCLGCHSLDGSKEIAPSWKDLYGADILLQDGSRITADSGYIQESIRDPNAKISAGFPPTMPVFPNLSDQDVSDLIAYMKTLSAYAPGVSPYPDSVNTISPSTMSDLGDVCSPTPS